eukprot:CAMPEP_0183545436 /NCGR_PEP_ID=MMETSP0371-20130417/51577_1 /TAXON_ID=268820 /ORGANISM="Peridinium aciculiferum, Strain PAER-2" /LENGTH=416 /DNA_ID=CAMNT_0025747597 /DNA_START=51 /DNA_END=1302 /DNA_ORIENTATION=+
MPLQSAHVFCSHIGHTGKTTLCFNMSCLYAKRHPDVRVLVMDLAEEGDLTKRLLGGVDAARGKDDEVFGSIFRLLSEAGRQSAPSSWVSSLLRSSSSELDIASHAIRVSEHNPNVPENLYLVSSGAWPRNEDPLPEEKRREIARKIRESLERASESWKLFCDTDGDRRPSPFTMLGYSLCSLAVVPLHLSKADLDRTETMLGLMNEMRKSGEISTQVLLIVWNMVTSQNNAAMEHKGLRLAFTPAKVSLDILDACNTRIAAIAKDEDFAGLFVSGGAETPDDEFIQGSIAVMRRLADNVLKPAEELGMPFVQMIDKLESSGHKQLTFETKDVKYSAGGDVIRGVDEAVRTLSEKLEALTVGAAELVCVLDHLLLEHVPGRPVQSDIFCGTERPMLMRALGTAGPSRASLCLCNTSA